MKNRMDEVLAYSRPIFNGADENKDGQLTIQEYAAFMHPELHIHMVDVLVDSFLEQYDNNDDRYISFYEFLGEKNSSNLIYWFIWFHSLCAQLFTCPRQQMREGETQTGLTPPERCSEKAWMRTRMACKMVESPVQCPAPCVCVCVVW